MYGPPELNRYLLDQRVVNQFSFELAPNIFGQYIINMADNRHVSHEIELNDAS
jgi:hypothetical protein